MKIKALCVDLVIDFQQHYFAKKREDNSLKISRGYIAIDITIIVYIKCQHRGESENFIN